MYVYATATTIVGPGRVRIYEGEVWAADDPVVKAHPDLFSDTPSKLRRTAPAPVETASAAPGEKRRTRAR